MEYMYWLVIGVLAAFLAKVQFPAKHDENIFGLLIIGGVGAVVGGWAMHAAAPAGVMSMVLWTYVAAFIGAGILLLTKRAVLGNSTA